MENVQPHLLGVCGNKSSIHYSIYVVFMSPVVSSKCLTTQYTQRLGDMKDKLYQITYSYCLNGCALFSYGYVTVFDGFIPISIVIPIFFRMSWLILGKWHGCWLLSVSEVIINGVGTICPNLASTKQSKTWTIRTIFAISQHGYEVTRLVKCSMKLLIHSQTSTV